nr:NnrS family protein [Burkholderiales bacterium]
LYAISSLAERVGANGLGLAPMHALTIGFASSLLMAMVTRVTCGHTGRTLQADSATWRLFLLLQVAAVARVAAELVPVPGALALAGALYAASFVPWAVKYAPLYWRPRGDGRPG